MNIKAILVTIASSLIITSYAQEAPIGAISEKSKDEVKLLDGIKGKIKGKIVWSSSRSNSKHDLWIMDADGTNEKQLTKGDNVDWFSRFSPDGKSVLFVRSKSGWVPEGDAEIFDKWDIWTVDNDGNNETKLVDNACWGTWRPSGDSIVFARGSKVFCKDIKSGTEIEIFDAETVIKKGAYAQEPQLSPDGKFLAITIRGSKRETGVYNRDIKEWNPLSGGCQIDWFPDSKRVLWMNEGQGNGGTEVLSTEIDESGKSKVKISGLSIPKEIRFMDLSGRRSHEYFPKIDNTGNYLIWCATQYGHEHDIFDYEVYLWNIKTDKKKDPVRLTFHSGNDRWPDLYIE
jgi:Tol biopolymer transport system component